MRTLSVLIAALAVAEAAPELRRAVTSSSATVSSNDGKNKLNTTTAPVKGNGNPNGASQWSISMDDTSTGYLQAIDGFGAAITDATVSVISALSSSDQTALLNKIFSSSGANFNLLRHTIGGSDLSPTEYTYDDTKNDNALAQFSLGQYGNAMTALLKKVAGIQSGIKLLGSVWSVPGWLKLNGVIDGNTTNNNLDLSKGSIIAQYFVKYIQAFQNASVTVNYLTVQNEPLNSQSGYPTCYVSQQDEVNLINNYLGPAFKKAGITTQIWGYDHNTDVPSYPQYVLNNAGSYVNTTAWHCYAQNNNWGVLSDFHKNNTNVKQYMTECWTSPNTGWDQVLGFTSGPLQNWASGVIAWTLGSDTNYGPHLSGGCSSCRGLVTVDTSNKNYTLNTDFYFLAQYSKYIQRGATMLNTTGSYSYGNGQQVQAVAALNPDKSRTLVFWNGFNNQVYLTLTTKSGETWSGPLYAQSATTWTLPASP